MLISSRIPLTMDMLSACDLNTRCQWHPKLKGKVFASLGYASGSSHIRCEVGLLKSSLLTIAVACQQCLSDHDGIPHDDQHFKEGIAHQSFFKGSEMDTSIS